MHINVTFLIQVINFLITYKILKTFLFRPVLSSIKEKKEKREKFEQSIEKKEQELIVLEKKKIENVDIFQKHVKKTYPFVASTTCDKPQLEFTPEKETVDREKIKKDVVDWLVEKVPDGY